jgi:GT2 family glycosyltransferase
MSARISAVILSFNSLRHLAPCVRSLARSLAPGDEIWVVENGSTDGSVAALEALAAEHPGLVRPIWCDTNTGTTRSRNMALRQATGRYVLVLDSDVTVPDGAIDALAARLDADPSIGLIAPRLTYPDGRFQLSVDAFPTIGRKLARFLALKAMEQRADGAPLSARDVDYAISAFWLMPRTTVERVGLFDEAIFYSPEDVDYCIRVWETGLRIRYEPSVSVVHDAREISRGFKLPRFTFSHAGGLAYLFRKHRYGIGLRRLYRRLGRDRLARP